MATTTGTAELSTPEDRKARSLRWKSLAAAFLGWTLDAMDWMILSIVLSQVGKEFNVGLAQLGMLGTVTLLGAAVSGLFVGVIADYLGRVRVLTFTMIWYALATAACGFAESFTQLLILRFITGIGLGGEWGVGAALVSEYWPEQYRARATSLVHSGWPIGFGLASLASIYILPTLGWRYMFYLGIIPAFVAMWVRLSVPEPEEWQKSKAAAADKRAKGETVKSLGIVTPLSRPIPTPS
jgi:MFS family permease